MTRVQDIEPSPGSFGDALRKQIEEEREMANNGAGDGTTDHEHNVQVRGDIIRGGFNEIFGLEAEIARAIEEHVEPLKKKRTKKWRDMKKDLDIPRKVLELQYKQYKMARLAHEDDDEDNGDSTLDDMREVYLALHPGETLDWIAAIDSTLPDQRSMN